MGACLQPMFECSARDKFLDIPDTPINDLQSLVAQIGDLQQAVKKSDMRLAEVEVALHNSKQQLVQMEAAVVRANQKSRSLEVAVEDALKRPRTPSPKANSLLSPELRTPVRTPHFDTHATDEPVTPRFEAFSPEQRSNHGRSNLAAAEERSNEQALPPGEVQAPTLQDAEFVTGRPLQERMSSLEILVSNLWQFHVMAMWLPAPPGNGHSDSSLQVLSADFAGTSSSGMLMSSPSSHAELGERISKVEQQLSLLRAEVFGAQYRFGETGVDSEEKYSARDRVDIYTSGPGLTPEGAGFFTTL